MGAPAHQPHSLASHSVILSWSRAMIEGSQRDLKWDSLIPFEISGREEKCKKKKSSELDPRLQEAAGREKKKRERERTKDVMESLACFYTCARRREASIFSISLRSFISPCYSLCNNLLPPTRWFIWNTLRQRSSGVHRIPATTIHNCT